MEDSALVGLRRCRVHDGKRILAAGDGLAGPPGAFGGPVAPRVDLRLDLVRVTRLSVTRAGTPCMSAMSGPMLASSAATASPNGVSSCSTCALQSSISRAPASATRPRAALSDVSSRSCCR